MQKSQWRVCYQSRVGPLEWIGPSLDDELISASEDKVGVIILPIAFVSEHSETLVELDIEYKEIAERLGISYYNRVPALGIQPKFIQCLDDLVKTAVQNDRQISPGFREKRCSDDIHKCIVQEISGPC